jgi:hypothetical protein
METNIKKKQTTENFIKDVRRKTRKVFSSEEKIQVVTTPNHLSYPYNLISSNNLLISD